MKKKTGKAIKVFEDFGKITGVLTFVLKLLEFLLSLLKK